MKRVIATGRIQSRGTCIMRTSYVEISSDMHSRFVSQDSRDKLKAEERDDETPE